MSEVLGIVCRENNWLEQRRELADVELEILRDTGTLPRVVRRVFNACVSSGADIADNWLPAEL
jgi:hypothetical protein